MMKGEPDEGLLVTGEAVQAFVPDRAEVMVTIQTATASGSIAVSFGIMME